MSDASPRWPKVTRDNPCPKCGHTDRCTITPDRLRGRCWRDGKTWSDDPRAKKSEPTPIEHRPAQKAKPKTVYRTPDEAVTTARLGIRGGATLANQWTYHHPDGSDAMIVARFDLPDGSKQFRPIHPTTGGWSIGDPPGRLPLYHLPDITPDGIVYVTEGEKCCEAARSIGLVATTSAHGAQSAGKTDWTPLAGREVCILPDRDDAGERYADAVIDILTGLTPPAKVKIVRLPLPEGVDPDGFDIADWCDYRDSDEPAVLRNFITGLTDAADWIVPTPPVETVLIGLDTIEAEPIEWLWENRIEIGAINLIVGAPGGGKTFTICDVAARITTGRDWPDGARCERGAVLIANAEDDPARVIRPRFDAHGGDPSLVQLLDCVRTRSTDGTITERGFTLADVSAIERALDQMPDCRLVVIDPIGSFLGERVDAHRDNEVRGTLQPLVRLARQRRIAVLIVMHTRKGGGGGADERALGSRAFVGLARSVYHLMPDPHTENLRMLLPGKANNAPSVKGLAFTIDGDPPAICWNREPVDMTADEAYGELDRPDDGDSQPGPKPQKHDAAKQFLLTVLEHGERAVKDIEAEAKAAGIAMRTVQRAATHLNVIRQKGGMSGGWEWRFKRDGNGKPILPQLAKIDDEAPKGKQLGNLASFGFLIPPKPILDDLAPEDAKLVCLGVLRESDAAKSPDEPDPPPGEKDAA